MDIRGSMGLFKYLPKKQPIDINKIKGALSFFRLLEQVLYKTKVVQVLTRHLNSSATTCKNKTQLNTVNWKVILLPGHSCLRKFSSSTTEQQDACSGSEDGGVLSSDTSSANRWATRWTDGARSPSATSYERILGKSKHAQYKKY
jgi:hypothetical protein